MDKGLLHVLKTETGGGGGTFVSYLGSNHLRSNHGLSWDISFREVRCFSMEIMTSYRPYTGWKQVTKPGTTPQIRDTNIPQMRGCQL